MRRSHLLLLALLLCLPLAGCPEGDDDDSAAGGDDDDTTDDDDATSDDDDATADDDATGDDDDATGDDDDATGDDDDATPADSDGDGSPDELDCAPEDPAVFPGNPEICDGLDNDCEGTVDTGLPTQSYWPDADGDGLGDPDGVPVEDCQQPADTADNAEDCDDSNAALPADHYTDADADGFGTGSATWTCTPSADQVAQDGDCDDAEPAIFPGAPIESCDAVDTDCDGTIEEVYAANHASVQAAIDAAPAGAPVCLEGGAYYEESLSVTVDRVLGGLDPEDLPIVYGDVDDRALSVQGATLIAHDIEFQGASEGVLVDAGTFILRDGQINGTQADEQGGALHSTNSTLTLEGVLINGNFQETGGRGVVYIEGGTAVLDDVEITGNTMGGAVAGGALSVFGATLTLYEVTVAYNQFDSPLSGAFSGMVWIQSTSAEADRVVVAFNTVLGGNINGGAIYQAYGTVNWRNLAVVGNSVEALGSVYGGAMYAGQPGTTTSITNALFFDTEVTGETCTGGALMNSSAVTSITNTIVQNNAMTCTTVSGGAIHADGISEPAVTYTSLFGNSGDAFTSMTDPTGTNGVVQTDAIFVNGAGHPHTWDLSLDPTSPLIDAGDPAILDADGGASDLGPFGGPGGDWDPVY